MIDALPVREAGCSGRRSDDIPMIVGGITAPGARVNIVKVFARETAAEEHNTIHKTDERRLPCLGDDGEDEIISLAGGIQIDISRESTCVVRQAQTDPIRVSFASPQRLHQGMQSADRSTGRLPLVESRRLDFQCIGTRSMKDHTQRTSQTGCTHPASRVMPSAALP